MKPARKNCFIRMHPGVYESIRQLSETESVDINAINDRIARAFLESDAKPMYCIATPRCGDARSNWLDTELYKKLGDYCDQYANSVNQIFYTACVTYLQALQLLPAEFDGSDNSGMSNSFYPSSTVTC